MSAVSAGVVSIAVGDDHPYREEETRSSAWRGREVRHMAVGTDAHLEVERETSAEDQADENWQKLRKVAIEIGRWASYIFAWLVPALVYVGGVALAALASPVTAAASIPAFIASCFAIHKWAIPAIREKFNSLNEAR